MSDSVESSLRARLKVDLPPRLIAHMDRVVTIADELAKRWKLDVELARLMAQAHDVVRHLDDAEWIERAESFGVPIDSVDRANPVLLHGPVGAEELRARYNMTDERVLHAVWWHTPGHPDYPPEAWAMFIADKVEPRKAKKWKALKHVHEVALSVGLEQAALEYLDLRLKEAVREDKLVQPQLVLTRNALLERHPR